MDVGVDGLAKNLNDLPLEDAMISFASKQKNKVYRESGWLPFKFEYKCTETTSQLFDKFWNDIMSNLNDYDIVRNNLLIADRLSHIPDARNFPPSGPKEYKFVTEKKLWVHEREKSEEMQRRKLNDPKLLALKAHCLDFIKTLQNSPQRAEPRDSLPHISQSFISNASSRHSTPESMSVNVCQTLSDCETTENEISLEESYAK